MQNFSVIFAVQQVFNNDHAVVERYLCLFFLSTLNKLSNALCLIFNCKTHDAKSEVVSDFYCLLEVSV